MAKKSSNSKYEKRTLLIVGPDGAGKGLLTSYLEDDYSIVHASTCSEALEYLEDDSRPPALIMVDAYGPGVDGITLLKTLKKKGTNEEIPVLALLSDRFKIEACIQLGASEYLIRPYTSPEVVRLRVREAIELFESRKAIENTRYDNLTGLYTKQYLSFYIEQYEKQFPDKKMDAVFLDIVRFRIINNLYGRDFGDEILCKLAANLKKIATSLGGFVCRRNADQFLLYLPNDTDYIDKLRSASSGISGIKSSMIDIRLGIYRDVDKEVVVPERFHRAKIASDSISVNSAERVRYYDETFHKKQVFYERLVGDFENALELGQFDVYYQPKVSIQGDRHEIISAEALVRWIHPYYGLVSPAEFIPLFELQGLIEKLDKFVWKTVAVEMKKMRELFGKPIPVSVNISRLDIYDPKIIEFFTSLVDKYGIARSDYRIEVTETAYAEDSARITAVINELRKLGFVIELDDFGTGYSSLNILASIPIDVIKVDRMFIRNLETGEKDVKILESIIELAKKINLPVVAEGVETEEQLNLIKSFGAEYVQGYYFYKPMSAEDFENVLRANLSQV